MTQLTERQRQVFQFIQKQIATTGFPPTRAEIATELGFRSTNAAEDHLQALARKGVIAITRGASRGICLVAPDDEIAPTHADKWNLPLIGRVAAGQTILAEEHIEARFQLDPALFAETPDFLLKVRGESMRDAGILDGDLLAVRKVAEARNGQIVVARLGDEVTVKRFERDSNEIRLIAENPDFRPIVVRSGECPFAL